MVLAGCGSGSQQRAKAEIEKASGGKVSVGTTDESGQVTSTAQLPGGWPKEFPLPARAKAVFSSVQGDSMAVWFSGGSASDVKSFYQKELPKNGWKITASQSYSAGGATGTVIQISGHSLEGAIYTGKGAPGSSAFAGQFAFFVQLNRATESPDMSDSSNDYSGD
jgi:hypothetical protein